VRCEHHSRISTFVPADSCHQRRCTQARRTCIDEARSQPMRLQLGAPQLTCLRYLPERNRILRPKSSRPHTWSKKLKYRPPLSAFLNYGQLLYTYTQAFEIKLAYFVKWVAALWVCAGTPCWNTSAQDANRFLKALLHQIDSTF